ncbi:MAG: 50S ribosomal protein L4 [Gemmatimonadota bacterium]
MFKARYYKADGKKGRARPLPITLFDGVVNEPVMHQVITAYLANQRQGTSAGKNRSAVRGGSRKPWRQKGTGRARQGTIRAAQWVGGGRAFPPIPHSWNVKVPRKVKGLARRSAWNDRAEGERVILVDLPEFLQPKTAQLRTFLTSVDAFAVEGNGKVLVLTDGQKDNVYLSSRNVDGIHVLPFGQESAYDILWAGSVVVERSALDKLDAEATDEASDEATEGAAVSEGGEDA